MANVLLHGGPLDEQWVKAPTKNWRIVEVDGCVYHYNDEEGQYVYYRGEAKAKFVPPVLRTTKRGKNPKLEVD